MDLLLFNFHDIVLLMTVYQCVLFALLLIVIRRNNYLSDLFLAAFLLSQAAIPLDILISFGAGFRDLAIELSPNLFYTFGLAHWLEGPLLLWYVRSLLYKNYALKRSDLLLLLPVAAYGVYLFFTYFNLDYDDKINLLRGFDVADESFWAHSLGLSRELLRVAFGIACLWEISNARKQIRQSYSNIDKIDFAWLNTLAIAFLLIRLWAVLVSLAIIFSAHLHIKLDYRIMGLSSNYTVFIVVSALVFLSLSNASRFEGIEPETQNTDEKSQSKTPIDPAMVQELESLMHQEKPYLANILTLEQLAQQLGWSPRALSNLINRHFERNFFEYINQYRIEEAKRLLSLAENNHLTVMDIMIDSGFNSKATFNTLFKKRVGMTPSQFRKSLC